MNPASGFRMLEISANFMGLSGAIHPSLIWDGDTVILVDTGFPGQYPQIRQAIEAAGIPIEKLNKVILTHHDIDHIGGLTAIVNESPTAIQVLAHEEEKAYIQGEKQPLKLAKLEATLSSQPEEMRTVYERLKAGFELSKIKVDQTLVDGEVLPTLGGIRVLFTPGHTLGHICLYLNQSKTLVAGDALRVEDGALTATPEANNYAMDLYKKSLKKLTAYDIETVICYHGGMFQGDANRCIASLANNS
jgi:glyoxylase-like metal-dependent hydrolase (beta-lactamase superfamily II)